jgi:hypothetical protein
MTSLTCLQVPFFLKKKKKKIVQFSYSSLVIKVISFKNRLNLLSTGFELWVFSAICKLMNCMQLKVYGNKV